jgi:vancomycin resistance protein YoaR
MQRNNPGLTESLNWPGTLTQKLAIALAAFFVTVGGIMLVVTIAVHLMYSERILPGVTAFGMALGGRTQAEAEVLLQQADTYPEQGRVVLKVGEKSWVAKPADLGMKFDYKLTAQNAYLVGRGKSFMGWLIDPLLALMAGYPVAPVLVYDEQMAEQFLYGVASLVDQITIEAAISINGTTVELIPGQVGRNLDIPMALTELDSNLSSMKDFSIVLPVVESPPVILDAREQAAIVQKILFSPLSLAMPGGQGDVGPWVITVEDLAKMLVIRREDRGPLASYAVSIDQNLLREFLVGIEKTINRDMENARFVFNDDTRQLDLEKSAVVGRHLNIDTNIATITSGLLSGQHAITLSIEMDTPSILDDATADLLDIHELLWAETSYFYGSSPERIQNIKAAASRFHGLLVAPGATFSMSDALGDISLDNGYAEALIIFGDQTISGIGGGVCQVSTTLFRTAFHAGLPILERHAHAYRVSYYEQRPSGGNDPNLAGLDATVYVPIVDLKFKNDTQSWLLMETYVRSSSITWKFYSTSDGRSVEWQTTGPVNLVEPPEPLYRENPELAENEIKQIDWEAEGADVTVIRSVFRAGVLLFQDTFQTHYLPWQAIFEYGPGTEGIPTPEP